MAESPVAALRAASRALDRRIAATPASRDRTVDLMRAVSIAVVVIWHWAGSVTHRRDGEIVMPNPIDQVPLLWLATWLGQVMPVFFLVGGFANLAAWDRVDGSARAFLRLRLARLLRPTAVFLGVWAVIEVVLLIAVPDYPGVLSYGRVVAVPLWFLAAYVWVVLLIPLTAVAHRRAAVPTVVLLGLSVVAVDIARFGAGLELFGLVNTALVWIFVHQLGYLWRDGMLDSPGPALGARRSRPDRPGRRGGAPGLSALDGGHRRRPAQPHVPHHRGHRDTGGVPARRDRAAAPATGVLAAAATGLENRSSRPTQ